MYVKCFLYIIYYFFIELYNIGEICFYEKERLRWWVELKLGGFDYIFKKYILIGLVSY